MIKQESPNFVASFYAPNPMEVTYWIDLSTDANGNVIKSYTGNDWLPVNYFTNTDQSVEIKKLKQEIADEVNRAKQAEQKLTNDLNGKANKSTTLAGYGITNAYTKLETDAKAIEIAQAECARLVASAPETLNTLDEIAAALGDDPNFATTITNQLGTKANKSTTLAGYGITNAYTKLETDAKAIEIAQAECARLVASAPETLNTLDEIAAALGDDPNFATTITNQLGTKANKSDVYTKSEANNKINTAVANKVTSTDVTQIKIVDEIPEVGSQTPGILYIKLSAA